LPGSREDGKGFAVGGASFKVGMAQKIVGDSFARKGGKTGRDLPLVVLLLKWGWLKR
jgi:hypothetical protein